MKTRILLILQSSDSNKRRKEKRLSLIDYFGYNVAKRLNVKFLIGDEELKEVVVFKHAKYKILKSKEFAWVVVLKY